MAPIVWARRTLNSPFRRFPAWAVFLQTVALVLQEAKYFDFVEVLNLDAAEATATCMLPYGTTGQFYQKSVVVPASILLFGLLAVPLWNFLRRPPSAGCCLAKRQKIHAKIWDRMQKPNVVTIEHIRRAQMASYLYVLAPVTQAAVGMLICRPMSETCTEEFCTAVLVLDPSIECTHVDYYSIQAVATIIVFLMIVVIPLTLLRASRRVSRRRQTNLKLRMSDMKHWWNELDEDESGFLEANEIHQLLLRMHQPVDEKSFMKTVREFLAAGRVLQLEEATKQTKASFREREQGKEQESEKSEKETQRAPDRIRKLRRMKSSVRAVQLLSVLRDSHEESEFDMDMLAVTQEQFNRWYSRKCAMLIQSPYDVLFGTTRCVPCL